MAFFFIVGCVFTIIPNLHLIRRCVKCHPKKLLFTNSSLARSQLEIRY